MSEREEKIRRSNVVPASFSPKPEDFAPQITQELRSNQAHWARDFTINQIDHLKNIRRKTWYKRPDNWRFRNQDESDEKLTTEINASLTAQTIMLERISEWAGTHNKETFEQMLPKVWQGFVREVRGEPAPEAEEPVTEEAEEEPVLVVDLGSVEEQSLPSARYDDLAKKEKSAVKAPPEPQLGDVLAKMEADNEDG